jgi:hypothetical protein
MAQPAASTNPAPRRIGWKLGGGQLVGGLKETLFLNLSQDHILQVHPSSIGLYPDWPMSFSAEKQKPIPLIQFMGYSVLG